MHTNKNPESWKAEVVFTSASYQAKKFVFLLFINRKHSSLPQTRLLCTENVMKDRLVESARIRRAMEAIYTSVLPKGFSPFMYLR